MNKPLEWIEAYNKGFNDCLAKFVDTHPVKDKPHPKCDEACMYLCRLRELTDEEIYELADQCRKLANPNVEFARAILRKASEK